MFGARLHVELVVESVATMVKDEERKERHSADPKSSVNADAKKGGAGGKYTFGKPEEQDGCPIALDKKDPNYDSESEDKKQTAGAPK